MASLKQLLDSRTSQISSVSELESGVTSLGLGETGCVIFKAGSTFYRQNVNTLNCWQVPADGKVILEAWGGGGTSGVMCCCGFSMPANPGGYVKAEALVTTGEFVHYCAACSVTSNTVCCGYRGCRSCFCVANKVCGYADGGYEGRSICANSTGGYGWCCVVQAGMAILVCDYSSTGCAIIKNCYSPVSGVVCGPAAQNVKIIEGPVSCWNMTCCYGGNSGYYGTQHTGYPGGLKGICGGTAGWRLQHNSQPASTHRENQQNALLLAMKGVGNGAEECWSGYTDCGCYTNFYSPSGIGVGAPSFKTCGGTRGNSGAGGTGAVRITFIPA